MTWVDDVHTIVWLCAARRREEGSEEDAYRYFQHLHGQGRLLPTDDDYRRDRAEAAIRLQRGHTAATYLISLDAHPKVVQDMLGHSSIALTLNTCSHVVPALHREAAGHTRPAAADAG